MEVVSEVDWLALGLRHVGARGRLRYLLREVGLVVGSQGHCRLELTVIMFGKVYAVIHCFRV